MARTPSAASLPLAGGLPLVPMEDIFREFYDAIGRYDFAQAHRTLRLNTTALQNGPFQSASTALARLTECENLYCSLAFLKQKWFRRDVRLFLQNN